MTIQECIDKWKVEREKMGSSLNCFRGYVDYADQFIRDLEEIQKDQQAIEKEKDDWWKAYQERQEAQFKAWSTPKPPLGSKTAP